jgi:hypothetical protein
MSNEIKEIDWEEEDEKRERAMVKEELNHPNFREWLKGLLALTEANIVFFKLSGERRTMRCTLDESKIPNDKKPKSDGTRKVSPDTLAVYDLDKADWRSFRYDTIKEFDFDLPEDCEYPPTPTPVLFGEDNEGAEITLVDTQTSEDPNVIDVQAKTLH